MTTHKHTNRLIHSSSPYLLQHAHNPVDWHEWGAEAFERAKHEDKLVIVSIGYSACHWCHVMEHESFENEETAQLMNELFVCVKVDREERPDIDQIYMDAVQLLSGRGGWPLNCFVLPDGRPLHGGTYFPKQDWERTLKSLSDFYINKREEALEFATDLTNGIKKLDIIPASNEERVDIEKIIGQWKANFDMKFGGFGWSPKFPMPNNWQFFLQYHHHTKDADCYDAVMKTLVSMAEGGIYDQVGGGFARYSTDVFWKAPHFEKMLYDNGQLMQLYAEAYQQSKNPLFKKVVYHTHEWIKRELTSAEGMFYSALDADSEGVEGKFYIWTKSELQDILGNDEPLFSLYYSVDAYGNWEHSSNILYRTRSNEELEKLTSLSIVEIEKIIQKCNTHLLTERDKRIKPGLDDKAITSWNALMISGYAKAYQVFDEPEFLKMAKRSADFILENLLIDKRLYRIYKNGKVSIPAFAEDYACLTEALIQLYQVTFEEKYVLEANALMELSISYFYDADRKFFYFTSINDEALIARRIDFNDDVIPSANSVFAKCLQMLMYYYSNTDYENILDGMLQSIKPKIDKYPTGYSNWLQVMLNKEKGLYQIVLSGKDYKVSQNELDQIYLPNAVYALVQKDTQIPLLKDKPMSDALSIYVCIDKTCGLPQNNVQSVLAMFTL
jgi:uncharacterized protein YyaL (SSP411 family)